MKTGATMNARRAPAPDRAGDQGDASVDSRVMAIGFADMCGFTRVSRSLDERDLVPLLDRFETAAMLALPAAGATLVKLLGDGALFSAPTAEVAIDAASLMIAEAYADGRLLPVRAAVSMGRVVLRRGDCFGEVVNRTSRLLDTAVPHGIAVDQSVVVACPTRAFRPLGRRHLRDYGSWPVWSPLS